MKPNLFDPSVAIDSRRRQFLRMASAPMGAAALTACGGGEAAAEEAHSPAAVAPVSTPPPAAAPSPAAAPYSGPITAHGPLPDWVSSLPLMAWHEIPNTALSSVDPDPRPLGITGPLAKIVAWNGATLKRSGSVYMLGAAGGHNDYGGNEVDALALNAATPVWQQIGAPTPNDQICAGGVQFYVDRRPSSTHTYYATQFIDSRNRMVVFSSPGYTGPAGTPVPAGWPYTGDDRSFSFDVTNGDWDGPDYIATFPSQGDFTAALCVKHQITDDVYYSKCYGNGIWRWVAHTNQWVRLANSLSRSPWYSGAAIDPIRQRMLVVGGYGPGALPGAIDLLGQAVAATFTGLGADALNVSGYPGVVYDEAADCFFVLHITRDAKGTDAGTRLLRVDAGSWTVTEPATTGTQPIARANGIQNSIQYVPELRGLVIADSYGGNVKFMRTAA